MTMTNTAALRLRVYAKEALYLAEEIRLMQENGPDDSPKLNEARDAHADLLTIVKGYCLCMDDFLNKAHGITLARWYSALKDSDKVDDDVFEKLLFSGDDYDYDDDNF